MQNGETTVLLTDEQIVSYADALRESGGLVRPAAKRLGIDPEKLIEHVTTEERLAEFRPDTTEQGISAGTQQALDALLKELPVLNTALDMMALTPEQVAKARGFHNLSYKCFADIHHILGGGMVKSTLLLDDDVADIRRQLKLIGDTDAEREKILRDSLNKAVELQISAYDTAMGAMLKLRRQILDEAKGKGGKNHERPKAVLNLNE